MATLTFGYQPGDGSGNNTIGSGWATVYINDTGFTVYVNRIDLINVSVARSVTFAQFGIYDVIGASEPWNLLAVTDELTNIIVGSNTFTVVGDPISVAPDVAIAVCFRTSHFISCTDVDCTTPRVRENSSALLDPFKDVGSLLRIVPATIFGSDTGPGDTTNLLVPEVFSEPLSDGDPNIRVDRQLSEPLSGGVPEVRVPEVFDEPLSGGVPLVRVPEIFTEVLHLVLPEPYMSDTPFPGFGNSISDPSIPAAANPFSSGLPGLAFSVHKIPMFNTNLDEGASGNEVATSLTEFPRWKFELTYEYLEDKSGASSSLKKILGFFLSMRGRWNTWLFKDPDDYLVTAGVCGQTDGVTTQFYLCRTIGDFTEPVGQVDEDNDIDLYLDDVLINPADYTITMPNKVVFDVAPAAGELTGSFQFFFVCRFLEDEQDYEKFADKLWSLQTCEFRSVLQQ